MKDKIHSKLIEYGAAIGEESRIDLVNELFDLFGVVKPLKDNRTLSFMDWIDFNKYTTSNIGYVDKERKCISLDELWEKWHKYKESL